MLRCRSTSPISSRDAPLGIADNPAAFNALVRAAFIITEALLKTILCPGASYEDSRGVSFSAEAKVVLGCQVATVRNGNSKFR